MPDHDSSDSRALTRRRAAKASMTLAEAQLIVDQADSGTLDLALPGTADIVAEAQRVRLKAQVWGEGPTDDRRRHVKGAVVLVIAFVSVTIAGLIAALVTAV